MDNPSTYRGFHTPEEVAAIMVEHAVVKHRSRIDIVFGKAVSHLTPLHFERVKEPTTTRRSLQVFCSPLVVCSLKFLELARLPLPLPTLALQRS